MYQIDAVNCHDAFIKTLSRLTKEGKKISVRGHTTFEMLGVGISIEKPNQRVIIHPHRNNNIFAQIIESFWILSGRNDISAIEKFLPRASDFSDDGVVWRGGYGPRLRDWGSVSKDGYVINDEGLDQIEAVCELLKNDPNSRRAVIQIFDPSLDNMPSKDIPCNNWIHFIVRGGKLHMSIAVRSNDIVWGFSGINMFEWSVVQAVVAHNVGFGIGSMNFYVVSSHFYKRHSLRIKRMLSVAEESYADYGADRYLIPRSGIYSFNKVRNPNPEVSLDVLWSACDAVLDAANAGEPLIPFGDEFIDLCIFATHFYAEFLETRDVKHVLSLWRHPFLGTDLHYAAIEWLYRYCDREGEENDKKMVFDEAVNLDHTFAFKWLTHRLPPEEVLRGPKSDDLDPQFWDNYSQADWM